METEGGENEHTAAQGTSPGPAGASQAGAGGPSRPLHPRSFKLRFASQREQGRSYVSLVKPLGLPATVTDKFYSGGRGAAVDDESTRRALQRIQDMFRRGPRDKYHEPVTTSQVYGWYAEAAGAGAPPRWDRRFNHHIRDSAWLKARLCVLAADDKLKQL